MKKSDIGKRLIVSFNKTFKLFIPPNRIGEVIEYENNSYLIIGIERVKFFGAKLIVTYTCQNLSVTHKIPTRNIGFSSDYMEFYVHINTKDHLETDWISRDRDNLVRIGNVFECENNYYRWVTYSDLKFNFTTLEINALAEPIYPVDLKTARNKLINNKRKKIDLSVIK